MRAGCSFRRQAFGRRTRGGMIDQPVVRAAPLALRDVLHELMLGFEHVGRIGQPQPVGDAEDVRIHGDGVRAERTAHHDVRRLAPHTGQGFQRVVVGGHLAAEADGQLPRHQHEVFGLVVKQAAGLDDRLDLRRFGFCQRRRVGIGGKERGRDHIHLDVRALGGEHHGDEQLKRIGEVQRGPRVGVQPRQLGKNQAVLFFSVHGDCPSMC